MFYDISDIIEAQFKDEIGKDFNICYGDSVKRLDVMSIKVRGNVKNIEHFDKLNYKLEKVIREHLRGVNKQKV